MILTENTEICAEATALQEQRGEYHLGQAGTAVWERRALCRLVLGEAEEAKWAFQEEAIARRQHSHSTRIPRRTNRTI